jgi:hypothetical protein
MTRRLLAWAGAAALLLLGIGGVWTLYRPHTIALTETDIQARVNTQLNKDFAVTGPARLVISKVMVENATVHIEGGHVSVLIDMDGMLRTGKRFTLTASTLGVPEYVDGAFYFRPQRIQVQKFAYDGSPVNELFARTARRFASDDRLRQLVEDKDFRVEEWMATTAQAGAMHWLEHRPVYRPKDDVKGLLIRASLDAVNIEQDRVVITFTLWQLTLGVVVGLVALLAGICLTMALGRFGLFRIASWLID